MLGTADRIVDLQVLERDFFVLAALLVRLRQVYVGVLRALEATLCIFRTFLTTTIELCAFRNETVLARVLIHNSIE
jgi:hypothetical protein